jgi:hypothetical protein
MYVARNCTHEFVRALELQNRARCLWRKAKTKILLHPSMIATQAQSERTKLERVVNNMYPFLLPHVSLGLCAHVFPSL